MCGRGAHRRATTFKTSPALGRGRSGGSASAASGPGGHGQGLVRPWAQETTRTTTRTRACPPRSGSGHRPLRARPPHAGPHGPGGRSGQSRPLLPGGRRPQLPRPVGKRAAVWRQNTTVGVMGEKPADPGLEGPREQPLLCFGFLFLPRPLFPPVADANPPVHNWVWNKEKRHSQGVSSKLAGSPGAAVPG